MVVVVEGWVVEGRSGDDDSEWWCSHGGKEVCDYNGEGGGDMEKWWWYLGQGSGATDDGAVRQ